MKKLYDAVQRFCARHPRFGIPNLMLYIVAGNVIVYLLMMFTQTNDANALAFLTLNTSAVLKGELWRIITYVFVPTSSGIFWLLISLYFYYWIGSTLERQWGTAKFTLYYISGVLLTAVGVLIASLISGQSYTVAGSYYVNLSMFFAFAFLFPDHEILLFFFFPIKMKYLAYVDWILFAVQLIFGDWSTKAAIIASLINFFLFFGGDLIRFVKNQKKYGAQRRNFRREMKNNQNRYW